MCHSVLAAVLTVGVVVTAQAATFQHQLGHAPGAVLGPDHAPLPASVALTRRWENDICAATLENRGTQPVQVGSVVLAELDHGLAPATPIYGEGFTMLSQTGGTLAQPVDEGFYTDRQHYRIPEPQERRTLYGVMTLREDWRCTYFKLDANYWGTMPGGVHHDRNATRVEAYRRGMAAIRRGAGDAFILGCNHPLWPSLGLIHGSRSSMDVSRDWHHITKTGRENLRRGWQNGRLWWNDPDALCLNGQVLTDVPDAAGLVRSIGQASDDEFLFHATLVHATGGMLLAGDDPRTYGDLEKQRLDILLPPTGRAMRFEGDNFEVGRLTLPEAEMVAVLNWKDVPQEIAVPLHERVRVTELWSGQDLGVQEGQLKWSAVSPHSGRLLRLVPVGSAGEGR